MANEKQNKAENQKEDNEKTGGLAGTGAGIIAGAQVGTVLLPIPVVGTFAGALVGGMIGSKVGKRVGGALLDKFNSATGGDSRADAADSANKKDITAELERLAKLREKGVLSEAEFKAAKAKLLNL
ncbi:MAG: SHOCT domain-containing protein [Pyrinomonadaceae bacterium]